MVMSRLRSSRTAHRTPGEHRAQGRQRGVAMGLHFLSAESPAHAQNLHGHLVGADAEHMRDDVLGLGGMLGGAVDHDLPALIDQGQRVLGFQVEVLLPGELEVALENMGRLRKGGLRVTLGDLGLDAVEALAAIASLMVISESSGS